jgi:hypothetical protein
MILHQEMLTRAFSYDYWEGWFASAAAGAFRALVLFWGVILARCYFLLNFCIYIKFIFALP